jgi:hypothetical protein
MTETIEATEPLIHYIMDKAFYEYQLKGTELFSENEMVEISCTCPSKLAIKLPANNLYPWIDNQLSVAQFRSFMEGTEFYSEVSINSTISKILAVMKSFFPNNQITCFCSI